MSRDRCLAESITSQAGSTTAVPLTRIPDVEIPRGATFRVLGRPISMPWWMVSAMRRHFGLRHAK